LRSAREVRQAASGDLRHRSRSARPDELDMVPWLQHLSPSERAQATAQLKVAEALPGEFVCKIGRTANYWFGVLDGLLKMSNDAAANAQITFTGVPPGAWFGEGTLLKREAYRYNIEPLRPSVVAGLPIESFEALLQASIPFNRYVMNQLNERLSQFIGAREIDRIIDPDLRVARSLASLFHPVLYPGVGHLLRITQQELAYLVGLSRQRVNEALRALQSAGLIRIEYGGVRVTDLPRLQSHGLLRPAAGD
jgi:CRP/FNR family transcriptional regulator, cyclic AMP receptor protein